MKLFARTSKDTELSSAPLTPESQLAALSEQETRWAGLLATTDIPTSEIVPELQAVIAERAKLLADNPQLQI